MTLAGSWAGTIGTDQKQRAQFSNYYTRHPLTTNQERTNMARRTKKASEERGALRSLPFTCLRLLVQLVILVCECVRKVGEFCRKMVRWGHLKVNFQVSKCFLSGKGEAAEEPSSLGGLQNFLKFHGERTDPRTKLKSCGWHEGNGEFDSWWFTRIFGEFCSLW